MAGYKLYLMTICLTITCVIGAKTGGKTRIHNCPECTVCSGRPIYLRASSVKRVLTSPGYPHQYGGPLLCKWLIKTDSEYKIRFNVLDTSLEPSTGCGNDFITVHDGPTQIYRKLFRWCGHRKPTILPTANSAMVIFKTNLRDSRRGFAIEYWSEKQVIVRYAKTTISFYQYLMFGVLGLTALTILSVILLITSMEQIKTLLGYIRRLASGRKELTDQSGGEFYTLSD